MVVAARAAAVDLRLAVAMVLLLVRVLLPLLFVLLPLLPGRFLSRMVGKVRGVQLATRHC